MNNIPVLIAEAKKYGVRRVVGKGEDGNRLLDAIQEELDAKPTRLVAAFDEITPQSKPATEPESPSDKRGKGSKAN